MTVFKFHPTQLTLLVFQPALALGNTAHVLPPPLPSPHPVFITNTFLASVRPPLHTQTEKGKPQNLSFKQSLSTD